MLRPAQAQFPQHLPQLAGTDCFANNKVLGENCSVPYRGLLLLRVRITFVICSTRGV